MSAKVLQLVNSSYFSTGRVTSSIERAIEYLGTERLRYIVLSASVFAPLGEPAPGFSLARFQETSLRVAQLSERFVPSAGPAAFVAGLLHDVGLLVLALGMPARAGVGAGGRARAGRGGAARRARARRICRARCGRSRRERTPLVRARRAVVMAV
jgi:HD-like signal output (HDOD) protein